MNPSFKHFTFGPKIHFSKENFETSKIFYKNLKFFETLFNKFQMFSFLESPFKSSESPMNDIIFFRNLPHNKNLNKIDFNHQGTIEKGMKILENLGEHLL